MPYRNGRQGMASGLQPSKVTHFTAPWSWAQRPPIVRIGNTILPVEESPKFLRLWRHSHLSFKKHISVLKTQCKEALNLIRVVAHLKWGGDRDTLLMLYRAIVRSKFDYGCIVYGTASITNLRHMDSIHNSGLRLAMGAFCTSPVSSLYTVDHMTKSTLMAPKWTRKWGQRRSSTAIFRMVRQPAANCPKDCQTTAPSLQLRLQPSV